MARKRRKRVSREIPAKGRLRDMADQLWSLAIRDDWAHKCAVCSSTGRVEAHHMIPRQHEATRYVLRNGILLCARHHQFDPAISPHQNAAGWMAWLRDNHPHVCQWYVKTVAGNYRDWDGTKNPAYYCDTIRRLRQYVDDVQFETVCGIRFSAWLSVGSD